MDRPERLGGAPDVPALRQRERRSLFWRGEVCEIPDSALAALAALVRSSVVLHLPAFPSTEVGAREFASRCDLSGSFDQAWRRPTTRGTRVGPLESCQNLRHDISRR